MSALAPRLLRFTGSWIQEFLLDDDLPPFDPPDEMRPMRVVEYPFPGGGDTYVISEGRGAPAPIYNYLNDKVYLSGTKNGADIIVKFDPRTLTIDAEVASAGLVLWDVMGDTLVAYVGGMGGSAVMIYDADTLALACTFDVTALSPGYIQAAPHKRVVVPHNEAPDYNNAGAHILTVTGPTTVSDSGLIPFPGGTANPWVNESGGYQRPYISVGDKMWISQGDDFFSGHTYAGFILDLGARTFAGVTSSDYSGSTPSYDPSTNIIVVNLPVDVPEGGNYDVAVATHSIIGGLGIVAASTQDYSSIWGFTAGDGTHFIASLTTLGRFSLTNPLAEPLVEYETVSDTTTNAGSFLGGNFYSSSAMAFSPSVFWTKYVLSVESL